MSPDLLLQIRLTLQLQLTNTTTTILTRLQQLLPLLTIIAETEIVTDITERARYEHNYAVVVRERFMD